MRRDRGVTLVELTVVIAILGVITTVISGGIVVLLRSNPVISQSIGESHDQQQLLNYLYEDVRATESVDVNTSYELLGYTRDASAPGCSPPGSVGPNVLQLTWRNDDGLQRSSYRLTEGVEGALLQRDHCAVGGAVDTWPAVPPVGMTIGTTNIADRLDHIPADWDSSGAPARVTVDGDVLTMVLTQSGRELHASATLRGDIGLLPSPPTTSPPPTTAVATTTTVPEPTTSTTTTTTPPGVLDGVCDLLADITTVLDVPTGPVQVLREYGADGLAGVLTTKVRVDARVSASAHLTLLDLLTLDVSLCASVQLAVNTGTTVVRMPVVAATPQCIGIPGVLCLSVSVSLSAELAVVASQLWRDGPRPMWLERLDGSVIADSESTLNVSLNTASVPPPPITVPTVGQGQPLNPLAAAQGFSVMVEGDAALRGVTVNGAVAAGGNLHFSSSQQGGATVATTSAATVSAPGDPSPLGLMVGGALDLTATPASAMAVANGFAHAGSLPGAKVLTNGAQTHVVPTAVGGTTGTPRVSVTGANQTDQLKHPVVRPLVFPFVNTFIALDRSSAGAAALTPTNCPAGHPTAPPQPALEFPEVYKQSGNWVLNLVPGSLTTPAVNVLNLTSKQLAAMVSVTGVVVPNESTTLVINVTDHGNVSIAAPTWSQLTAARVQSVLWNFPNANRVTISGALRGSVLAPAAIVTLSGATVNGDVVGETLMTSGTSTVNVAHFDRQLPCIG